MSQQRRRRYRARGVKVTMSAFERKDIGKFVMELNYIAGKGTLDDKKVMWSYVQDVVRNEFLKVSKNKGSHGMRWSQDSKDFLAVQKLTGGKGICLQQVKNIGGPSLSTTHRSIRKVRTKLFSGLDRCEANFQHVVTIWKPLIDQWHKTNQDSGKELVPCELSEDETGIIPILEYDEDTDSVMGTCGWRVEGHRCDPDFAPVIGDDWDNLVHIIKNCVPATYARVIMVNPCVSFLKPAVVFACCTCNKFKHFGHRGDIVSQWDTTLKCFDNCLAPLGFFFTGRGSDGDARRYLLQHATWYQHAVKLRKWTIAVRKIQRFWFNNRRIVAATRIQRFWRNPVLSRIAIAIRAHFRSIRNQTLARVLPFSGWIPISLSSMVVGTARGFNFACRGKFRCVLLLCGESNV